MILLRPVIELLDELTQVDPKFSQRSTDRRGRSRLSTGYLKFRLSDQLFRHGFQIPSTKGLQRVPASRGHRALSHFR